MRASAVIVALQVLFLASFAAGRITPALEPVSDDKFFRNRGDYPTDTRNNKVLPSHNKFTYPFPVLQDSKTYDADYVKDENKDNGYWKLQTEYDRLRRDVAKKQEDLEKAKAEEKQEAARHVKQEANKANKANTVEEAEAAVKQSALNLEKCLSELEAAKKELKRRQDAKAEAHQHEDEKEAEEHAAEDKKADALAEEVKSEEKLAEEQKEDEAAEMSLEEAQKKYDDLEDELQKAQAELQKFMPARKGASGSASGGVPCPKGCKDIKSAAPRAEASLVVCIVAAVLSVRMQ